MSMEIDLSTPPFDATKRRNYEQIYTLWTELRAKLDGRAAIDPGDFQAWDRKVSALLYRSERERFGKPLRPQLSKEPTVGDLAPHAKVMHLQKILLARHGIDPGGF